LRSTAWILTFVSLCMFTSCDEKIDTTPPVNPSLLPHTWETDTLPVESGTDAVPECSCILLEWIRNEEEDLKEYEIFRSGHDTSHFVSLTIVASSESTYLDRNLELIRFYYYMVARDQLDNTSDPSSFVDYKLTAKAIPKAPARWETLYSDSIAFEWTWDGGLEGIFLTRLYSLGGDSTVWMGWTNAYERPLRCYSPAVPAGDYKWRVDYIAPGENEGSESNWTPFYRK
jgi:hypothetical protein